MSGALVLLRHGQSVWNAENRFTGWVDVGLTERGVLEARRAGQLLTDAGIFPDVAYTSLLSRAIVTTNLALEKAERLWIPVERSWRLNERHYGALAGLDKAATTELYGAEQIHIWRRSYDTRPPTLDDVSAFRSDPRYLDVSDTDLPRSESLADVQARLLPYWNERILPQLEAGKTVMLGAHGNSLRALVKHIESISDEAVVELEIATGTPRIYQTSLTGSSLSFSSARILTTTHEISGSDAHR
jgi:2,3-bisphosphoglycerate-dependent phosphoglycerate mutase